MRFINSLSDRLLAVVAPRITAEAAVGPAACTTVWCYCRFGWEHYKQSGTGCPNVCRKHQTIC